MVSLRSYSKPEKTQTLSVTFFSRRIRKMHHELISWMIIGGIAIYAIILSRCVQDLMIELKEVKQ